MLYCGIMTNREPVLSKRVWGGPTPDNMLRPNQGKVYGDVRFSWPYLIWNATGFCSSIIGVITIPFAFVIAFEFMKILAYGEEYREKHPRPHKNPADYPAFRKITKVEPMPKPVLRKDPNLSPSPKHIYRPNFSSPPSCYGPPKWHKDPAGSGQMRYWDGQKWTDKYAKPGDFPTAIPDASPDGT